MLPWGRTDRSLLEFDSTLLVLNQAPLLGGVLLAVVVVLALSGLLHLSLVQRGYALVGLGGTAFLAGVGWLVATSVPFGVGAFIALTALLVMVGIGLSESGIIQNDPFVTSSILLTSLFVTLFIVYPLFTVLRESVMVKGIFTLNKIQGVLTSPLFITIENPYTDRSEQLLVNLTTLVMGLIGAGLAARGVCAGLESSPGWWWVWCWAGLSGQGFSAAEPSRPASTWP